MITDKHSALLAADAYKAIGGSIAVVSPGSRNAPLVKSFQNGNVELLSIVDERSAAFFALGIAIQTKNPVALICTSGTALLNYAPALAEAYYLGKSIIVLSADRPENLIDQGVGQAIRQQNVYSNFQKGFIQLPLNMNTEHKQQKQYAALVDLFMKSKSGFPGPVHVNIPFDEPLYNSTESEYKSPQLSTNQNLATPNFTISSNLVHEFNESKRVMLLCGVLEKHTRIKTAIENISSLNSIIVLKEHTSNLQSDKMISTIDRTLELVTDELMPDLVITLGENVVSKKIKKFIEASNTKHWHVSVEGVERNTFGKLTQAITCSTEDFVEQLYAKCAKKSTSSYRSSWLHADQLAQKRHIEYLKHCPYSDLYVFNELITKIPFDMHLQSGNSSVVRYFQLFKNIPFSYFHANRGTSGIDGSTSTAVGYCYTAEAPTLFVTGDLSFMYDSNGLWNNYVSPNLRIVILNNGGGGIFRIIPGPKTVDNFETYLEGNHDMSFKGIVENFGLEYMLSEDEADLKHALSSFFEPSSVAKVLEIKTPNTVNDAVLKRYFNYIKTGEREKMA